MRFLSILFVFFVLACSQAKETQSQENQVATKPPTLNASAIEKLVQADKVDGTEDHIVSNCSGCALAMKGKESYSVHISDYEMHFCSDYCKKSFEKTPDESLEKLIIPAI